MWRFSDKDKLFLLILNNKKHELKKGYVTFILLYLWAKYEHIWLYFTVQTVIFSAHYLQHIFWRKLYRQLVRIFSSVYW